MSASDPATGAAPRRNPFAPPPDVSGPPPRAHRTGTGLVYKTIQESESDVYAGPKDTVVVHYNGWTTDGRLFDSSLKRGQPAMFPLDSVIKGWAEGLQMMSIGQRCMFWIPAGLAYGDQPRGKQPGGMLVFDVKLLGIRETMFAEAPAHVASPPPGTARTKSRLSYEVLIEGGGRYRPLPDDMVKMHFAMWTIDGNTVDTTLRSGRPRVSRVGDLIEGWSEGLQMMVVGQRNRLWIPAHLAYGSRPTQPGAPAGMLCMDVELLDVGRRRPGTGKH